MEHQGKQTRQPQVPPIPHSHLPPPRPPPQPMAPPSVDFQQPTGPMASMLGLPLQQPAPQSFPHHQQPWCQQPPQHMLHHGATPPPPCFRPPHLSTRHLLLPPPPAYVMGTPDVRIHEMNKRLQQRPEYESDGQNLWWDQFATEFFEDDSVLTIQMLLEDGPKRYCIGRTLIPRYFRSIFEGGVVDLYIFLKNARESFHNTSLTLDCERGEMHATHVRPMLTNVVTEGRLILEFTFDDMMRIRSWLFQIRSCREMIPRQAVSSQQDPMLLDQMSRNITRQGVTSHTLHFLRLCVILEPMQELMSRQKAYGLHPRDCLKTTLFQKWQRMVAPPDSGKQPSKKRKRKNNSTASAAGGGMGCGASTTKGKKKATPASSATTAASSSAAAAQSAQPQPPLPSFGHHGSEQGDMMTVGEPTLMGGDFGTEDERLITRLENRQFFEPADAAAQAMGANGCRRNVVDFPGPHAALYSCSDNDGAEILLDEAPTIGRFTSMLNQHGPPPGQQPACRGKQVRQHKQLRASSDSVSCAQSNGGIHGSPPKHQCLTPCPYLEQCSGTPTTSSAEHHQYSQYQSYHQFRNQLGAPLPLEQFDAASPELGGLYASQGPSETQQQQQQQQQPHASITA